MSAFDERVKQDLIKLNGLSKATGNKVSVVNTVGNPVNKIEIELRYITAPSISFPAEKQNITKVKIDLLSRYPFQEPSATITTPIYHPNVYTSGKVCFGTKWLPSQGLDLLIKRVIQIITFDPVILNGDSPANTSALSWYYKAIKKYPDAFPSDRYVEGSPEATKPKIKWGTESNSSSVAEKVVIKCQSCNAGLRIPKGKSGNLKCPKCNAIFSVNT